jgi:hypothetical protein
MDLIQVAIDKLDDSDNIGTVTDEDVQAVSRHLGGDGTFDVVDEGVWLVDVSVKSLRRLERTGALLDQLCRDGWALIIVAEMP